MNKSVDAYPRGDRMMGMKQSFDKFVSRATSVLTAGAIMANSACAAFPRPVNPSESGGQTQEATLAPIVDVNVYNEKMISSLPDSQDKVRLNSLKFDESVKLAVKYNSDSPMGEFVFGSVNILEMKVNNVLVNNVCGTLVEKSGKKVTVWEKQIKSTADGVLIIEDKTIGKVVNKIDMGNGEDMYAAGNGIFKTNMFVTKDNKLSMIFVDGKPVSVDGSDIIESGDWVVQAEALPTETATATTTKTATATLEPTKTATTTQTLVEAKPTATQTSTSTAEATATVQATKEVRNMPKEVSKYLDAVYYEKIKGKYKDIEMEITVGITKTVANRLKEPVKSFEVNDPSKTADAIEYWLRACMENYKRNNSGNENMLFENYLELVKKGEGLITMGGFDESKSESLETAIAEEFKVSPLKGLVVLMGAGERLPLVDGSYYGGLNSEGVPVVVAHLLPADMFAEQRQYEGQEPGGFSVEYVLDNTFSGSVILGIIDATVYGTPACVVASQNALYSSGGPECGKSFSANGADFQDKFMQGVYRDWYFSGKTWIKISQ